MKSNVKSATAVKPGVIGQFEGECADSNVTNANGLDITREVWEFVFNSDDYKKGIENRWYIGYAGHPEDPGCDNPEKACIVMTEGHIDADGIVHGKFDLLDTPVGRVYKTLIDAGMRPGISVRGAGDVIDNSVDPESFIFRGFDLVLFPAYPNSVPAFHEIAASTNFEDQKKYKKICAAVETNLDEITSLETLTQLQANFAKNSETYKKIESRKDELSELKDLTRESQIDDELESITGEKLACMTDMYLETCERVNVLEEEVRRLKDELAEVRVSAAKQLKVVKRITAAQISDEQAKSAHLNNRNKTLVSATTRLKKELNELSSKNLSYDQKARITAAKLTEKDSVIASLRLQLNETVTEAEKSKSRTSNLDVKIKKLDTQITAAKKLLSQYQSAYAELYANAVGTDLSNIKITADTTVPELQKVIGGLSVNQSIKCSPNVKYDDIDVIDEFDENNIVTL